MILYALQEEGISKADLELQKTNNLKKQKAARGMMRSIKLAADNAKDDKLKYLKGKAVK